MRWTMPPESLPEAWFNVVPRLAQPIEPPLHPGTREPAGPQDLAPLFPMALILQEVSTEPWIDIPGEVIDILRLWRPTPLVRARRLEQALDTPARIYYKDESVSPAGSHKPNTAVPQAYFNREEGIQRIATETGAGQWGSALAFAVRLLRPHLQGLHGAGLVQPEAVPPGDDRDLGGEVVPSPVDQPDSPGSLGMAISDAVGMPPVARTPTTRWDRCSTTCCSTRP